MQSHITLRYVTLLNKFKKRNKLAWWSSFDQKTKEIFLAQPSSRVKCGMTQCFKYEKTWQEYSCWRVRIVLGRAQWGVQARKQGWVTEWNQTKYSR